MRADPRISIATEPIERPLWHGEYRPQLRVHNSERNDLELSIHCFGVWDRHTKESRSAGAMSTGSGFSDLAGRLPSVGEVAIWRKASSNELQNDGRRVKYADHLEWRHPTSYFSINQECRLMPSPALPSQERDQIRGRMLFLASSRRG